MIRGSATISGGGISTELKPGGFCLIPADLKGVEIKTQPQTAFLCAEPN